MAYISNFLQDNMMNHVFRNTPYNAPGTIYLALFSADPTAAGTGPELSGSGYARTAFTLGPPTNGISTNDADIVFPTATANWLNATHIGIFDSSINGNLLFFGPMTSGVIVTSGNNFRFPIGNLTIGLN